MKNKIITILILISLTLSTIGITGSATQTISMDDTLPDPSKTIQVIKLIKNNTEWVPEINTTIGSTIRFQINVTYHDTDGDGKGFILTEIIVKDILPSGLEYAGNPTEPYDTITDDGKNITWDVNENLEDNESHIIEFDVLIIDAGVQINNVNVSAIEHCYGEQRWGNANATINVPPEVDAKYKDVDNDQNDEIAYNEDGNSTNGYEKFVDPDNSSEAVLSTDGDNDGKIDHFIDTNKDGLPDKYWDPDDDILTPIWQIDVDYDNTKEWVYDSNDDGKYDKYLDPDDGKIYPYIAYTLTTNVTPLGSGSVLVGPNGPFSPLYLKNFEVELTAIPNQGWKFVKYQGDINSNNPTVKVIMNSDKEITAVFEKEIILPTITITKPTINHWYFFNIELESTQEQPKIVGPLKIIADATSEKGIDRVEFYLNDETEPRNIDDTAPYTWTWLLKPIGREKTFTITAKAYDTEGYSKIDSITVTRSALLPKIILSGIIGIIGLNLLKNHETPPDDEPDLLSEYIIYGIIGLIILKIIKNRQQVDEDETIPVEPEPPNMEPVVDAGGPYTGVVGKPVIFDASDSYDPEGEALSYSWDFGDNSKGSGKTPTHTYATSGRYTVKLTVTDLNGASATDTTTVQITEQEKTSGLADNGDGLFWYVVSGLTTGLTALVGLLIFRRRLYV